MKEINPLKVGDIVDDLICDGKVKRKNNTYKYVMRCKKCGRVKEMLSSTIRRHSGTTHKACGKGIKTKEPIFYLRWQAMRTRTTNKNYWGAKYYSQKGINSDEFANFIDFYDKMYLSFKQLTDKIGAENTSLERIDNNESYTSENCIWVDKHSQPQNNSRIVKFKAIFPDGHYEICKNVREFARVHNLDNSTIFDCLSENRSTTNHKGYKFVRL